MGKFLGGVLATVVVIIVAFAGYFLGGLGSKDELKSVDLQQASAASLPLTSSASPSTSKPISTSQTVAAIKTALETKDYSSLSAFMDEKVNVIIYASSCCGDYTKAQAIDELKYLNSSKSPWDFDQQSERVKKLINDVPQYFKGKVITISDNKYTAAFGVNNRFLIDRIVLVVDYTIVAPF